MKTIVTDLPQLAARAAQLETDRRFKTWAKWVDRVDQSKTTGYAFVGDFIKNGTIEVSSDAPRLILVCAESGSMKYHHGHHAIAIWRPDGTLDYTGIVDHSGDAGWALRLRAQTADLLEEVQRGER